MVAALNFDPVNLLIYETGVLADGDTTWNIRDDFYKFWKDHELTLTDQQRAQFPRFMRYEGASPITDIQDTGTTFFLMDGWRFRPGEWDHEVTLEGNLWPDPFTNKSVVPTLGGYTVLIREKVSNLVDASVSRLDLNQLLKSVYIDTANGVAGTGATVGTPTNPSSNLADAYTIAVARNLNSFNVRGSITLDQNYSDWSFIGEGNIASNVVALGGYDVDGCYFERITMSGTMTGTIECSSCSLGVLSGLDGRFFHCELDQDFTLGASSVTKFINCSSGVTGVGTPVVTVGASSMLQFRNFSGGLQLASMDSSSIASVDLDPGHLILAASCTGGTISVKGSGRITRNDSLAVTVDDGGMLYGGVMTLTKTEASPDGYVQQV